MNNDKLDLQNAYYSVLKEQNVNEGIFDNIKAAGQAAKAGGQAFVKGLKDTAQATKTTYRMTKIEQFKNNITSYITELEEDLDKMNFDASKYSEINTALENIKKRLQFK